MRLHSKVAVITGGTSGIGRATAVVFAKEGANVVVAGRSAEGGQETLKQVRAAGGAGLFVRTDVSKAPAVENMVNKAVEAYGRLDVLVNNAAVLVRTPPLAEVWEEDWDMVLDINLKGTFLGCKYAIPEMLKVGGGSIINVSSLTGIRASYYSVPYGVSKAGIIQLTMTAANQYARNGIRVNCIIPGIIDTPQSRGLDGRTEEFNRKAARIPIGRAGSPEEVAYLALYLASDESSFVTGASLLIDGGSRTL